MNELLRSGKEGERSSLISVAGQSQEPGLSSFNRPVLLYGRLELL